MSDDVNIRISATDNATATLRAIQSEIGKFNSSIKSIAKFTVAGFGIREAGSFLADSVKAYAESERAVTMLDRVLKSTGNTIKMTRQQIQEYADARMAQTAFDDDAIVEAASQLARFRDISGDTFTATLDAAQDLATVMGTDLVSATQMLGRAMSDPAEGLAKLARAGVMFTDAQKKQIEVLDLIGNKAGQQKIILAELQRQFGGAAVQDASTASGQIQQLTNAIGELKEEIGKTLAGAILPLLNELRGKPSSLENAQGAIAASGVAPMLSKTAEIAAIDRQVGILDGQIRFIQGELRANQQTFLGGAGAWAEWTTDREMQIAQLRNTQRERLQQRAAIEAQAAAQAAQLAPFTGAMGALGGIGQSLFNNLPGGFMNGLNAITQGTNIGGVQIPGGAQALAMGQLNQMLGDWSPFAFHREEAQKQERKQEVERSLQATESRFLTRGRGSLSPEAKKAAEDNAKQLAELKSIRDAIANLGGNVLVVEGVA